MARVLVLIPKSGLECWNLVGLCLEIKVLPTNCKQSPLQNVSIKPNTQREEGICHWDITGCSSAWTHGWFYPSNSISIYRQNCTDSIIVTCTLDQLPAVLRTNLRQTSSIPGTRCHDVSCFPSLHDARLETLIARHPCQTKTLNPYLYTYIYIAKQCCSSGTARM